MGFSLHSLCEGVLHDTSDFERHFISITPATFDAWYAGLDPLISNVLDNVYQSQRSAPRSLVTLPWLVLQIEQLFATRLLCVGETRPRTR